MAQIDIKNATIAIQDGYAGPGGGGFHINNMTGYMTGATTVIVSGGTGIIATGDRFTIAGETGNTVHTVTAHTETLGNTTSVTFTPGLTGAIVDAALVTILPHTLNVKVGEGNVTYDEKRNVVYTKDRGIIDTVRLGDQEPMDVKLDFTWEFLKADTGNPPTVEDALKKRGEAAAWVTSSADPCEPYSVDIVITYTPPCGGAKREIIALPDFRYESLNHDLTKGAVAVSGKCNAQEAIITRAA